MNIKPLPSVEKEVEETMQKLGGIDRVDDPQMFNAFFNLLTKDRDQAYTSLVEGIEGMKSDPTLPADDALYSRSDIDREVDKTLTDIIEKVVKPLYGKE